MYADINELVGKTLKEVIQTPGGELLTFICNDETSYCMSHHQDCCESVSIESITGELQDLVGSPIVRAEENSSNDTPEDFKFEYEPDSFTWTFYRIGTAKGTVVIRWLGTSNGYYSEGVSFEKC